MKRISVMLVVVTAMISLCGRFSDVPARGADDDDTRAVWEINVNATRSEVITGKEFFSAQGVVTSHERRERHRAAMFATQRWHNQNTRGNVELGGGNEDPIVTTVSGSTEDEIYTRDVDADNVDVRDISSSGPVDQKSPNPGGASFLWDDQQKTGQFECSMETTGQATDIHRRQNRDPNLRLNARELREFHGNGQFGILDPDNGKMTCTPTKYGFLVTWSYHREFKDDANSHPQCSHSISISGSATIRKYSRHEPMELVISPAGYQAWLPQAAKDENTIGNTLNVTATLKTKNGKPIPDEQKAKKITFSLQKTSNLPGVCMNYPVSDGRSENPALDLQFDAADNAGMKLTPDKQPQKAETPDNSDQLIEASATIGCYDWGAHGDLVATAVLDDGEMIQGHLEDEDSVTTITVPRRNEGCYTAEYWKEQNGMTGKADDFDAEDDPKGDGTKGDGLTLFEEYRGFMSQGAHIFGDPKKKDFFVYDMINTSRSNDGIQLFARLTGMSVHKLNKDEWSETRIINDNDGMDSTHEVDQHGIKMIVSGNMGYSEAVPIPDDPAVMGTPKDFEMIRIDSPLSDGPDGWGEVSRGGKTYPADAYASILAHELLHTCNVSHHGDNDPGNVTWLESTDPKTGKSVVIETIVRDKGDNTPVPPGIQVQIKREDGTDISPDKFKKPYEPWVAAQQGQHSGYTDCVMRYDCADAYIAADNPAIRYWINGDQTGMNLCTSKTDVTGGENALDRIPRPRYGNAENGNCKNNFCVNDAAQK